MHSSSGIPDLNGKHFSIEYAQQDSDNSYPIPTNLVDSENKYPDARIVDELPKNIVQHVQASNNPTLLAALQPNLRLADQILTDDPTRKSSVSVIQPSIKVNRTFGTSVYSRVNPTAQRVNLKAILS